MRAGRLAIAAGAVLASFPLQLGLDLKGGVAITLEAKDDGKSDDFQRKEKITKAIEIISNRINGLGVSEAIVRPVGTNRIDISAVHDPRTGNFILTSAEDNLVKGASGQAVQIMNLWCGFEETAGLA